MAAITTTGTLTAGNSRTFNLAPASAVTLTLSPNVRVTITETPAIVAATGLGGNASRVHEPRLPGVVTYGPYPMGGSVLVEVESNSGSSVSWVRSDSIVAESADGLSSLVDGAGNSLSLIRTLFRKYVRIIHTGTTAETKVASFLIPAGSIIPPAAINFQSGLEYTTTATAGNRTFRLRMHTADAVGGTTMVSNIMTTQSVQQGVLRSDQIIFQSAAVQRGAAANAGWNGLQGNAFNFTTFTPATQDLWIVATAQLADAADSFSLMSLEATLPVS